MTRRPFDPLSLVSGLLFIGLGIAFVLDRTGHVDLDLHWIGPITLIALGLGWMLTGLRRQRDGES